MGIWLWKFHLTKDAILRNSKIVVGIWADKWFNGDNEILILSTNRIVCELSCEQNSLD